ncbi:hypothetical protein C1I95_14740 [Micromonospora craterilacus]|uniref:Uncharacterized protein n=1 Tax=Micromonospora craterilacus TaxID=1655439 RepID=A0A2W2FS18_9ACTN|nr:hypothetical protein [Micromonospora craterilacus]PZG17804.1 hypothetical protein C1I95_14740 [Micromonospora craterilacus]
MGTYVDAERAVADWINSLTASLVGLGRPLSKGAHLTELRGAASACYALLSLLPGGVALGVENPDHRARISASIYGPTKEAATVAAIAYADTLLTCDGRPQPMGAAVCLVVDPDSVTGPLWLPDQAGPRLLVDADFYLRPA